MAKIRKRVAPVKLAGMSGTQFKESLNGLRKRADGKGGYTGVDLASDFMINVDAKLFTGATATNKAGEKGYVGIPGSIAINAATMCNLDPDLLQAMGVELTADQAEAVAHGTCDPQFGGNFDVENAGVDFRDFKTYPDGETALPATPVGMKVEYDPDANNTYGELGKYTVTPAIDFHALGEASTREQNRIREDRGKAPLSKAQEGRLKVVSSFAVTKDGLGGMNQERVGQNLAKCAATNGLMSTSKPEDLPTADQVKGVAELYTQTFDTLVKDLSGKKGVTVAGIKDPSKAVSCPSLKDMGIQAKEVNGATVLTVIGGEDSKQARRDGLKQFNEVFNARWKQEVNRRDPADASKYVHDATTVSLGNQMSLNSRAVTVRNPENREAKTGLVLVQPGMDFTMTPYADKLGMSVGSAMHGLMDGTTPESLYSKEMLDAASALSTALDTPSLDREAAIAANKAQFQAICEANGLDASKKLEAPAVATEEATNDGPEIEA